MPSLKKNIAYNFIYQLLILVLPLVTAPYLSRVIGAEGVGTYSYSYSIATYFSYFVKLGLDNYGNREISKVRDDRAERSSTFWQIYTMQAACFFAVAIAYACYAVFFSGDSIVAALQGIFILSSLFDINWFFFGMERFRATVTRNTVIKVLTTICIFLLVRNRGDVETYVAVMCTGFLVSQLALWPYLLTLVDVIRPAWRDVAKRFRPNVTLFVPVIAVSVYGVLSRIVLGAISGTAEVGFYDNAYKIIQVPVSLVTAVGTVMLPRVTGLVSQGMDDEASRYTERTLVIVMALTFLASFGIPTIADSFTLLFYGDGFETTAKVMCVLSLTVPLLGFGNVLRSQYLIPHSRDSVYLCSAICGAVANIVVNLLLIPQLGAIGAAVGSVAAEASVLLYQLLMVRGEIPIHRYLKIAAASFGAGAVMYIILLLIPQTGSAVIDVVLSVFAGCTVFAASSVLTYRFVGLSGDSISGRKTHR